MIIENKTSIKNRANFKLFYEKNNKNSPFKGDYFEEGVTLNYEFKMLK